MSAGPHDPQGSRVVLVGAHDFTHLAPLPAVSRNLTRLRELLTDPRVWGLPARNCVVIEQPEHRDEVLDALADAAAAATDLVLLYYAGHGLISPDTEDLLLSLPRCRPDRAYTTLPFQDVRNVLRSARRVPAKAVLLDCCFAGRALTGAMGAEDTRLAELSRVEGTYVLAAASATRQAIAPAGERYTAFTGRLIDVLEHGVPGGPRALDLATVHDHLHRVLPESGFPAPQQRNDDHGARIVLGWNRHPSAADHVPRLPPHLRELLHAQAIAARNFTYRLYDAPLDGLATVYVRQQARSAPTTGTTVETREEFRDHERNRHDGERRRRHFVPVESAVQPVAPARAAEDTLGLHRHVLITGGAGQGKSTLSLQLAASLAADYAAHAAQAPGAAAGPEGPAGPERKDRPERLLPLRVTAGRLAADRSALVPRLVRILSEELAPHLDYALPDDLLENLPEGTTCLLIVDGLDEITDPERRRALVAELAGRVRNPDSRFRLLITTRPLPNDELAPLQHAATGTYTLEPFDREQLREFAHRWFRDHADGQARAEGFLRQTEAAGIRDLVRIPLLSTVAALVYRKHPGTPLPSSRFTLYCDYFTLLAEAHLREVHEQQQTVLHRWTLRPAAHRASAAFLFEHRAELIEHLAVTVVTDPTAATRAVLDLALDWLDSHGCRPTRRGVSEWPGLVTSVLGASGVFTHHTDHLRFTHYSFAEHIAADVRADRLPTRFDATDPDWAHTVRRAVTGDLFAHAVLTHHAHRYDSGDAVLAWLTRGTGDYAALAGELLAGGVPASAAHVESFAAHLVLTLTMPPGRERLQRVVSDAAALIRQPAVRRVLDDYLASCYVNRELRVGIAQSLIAHDPGIAADILHDVLAATDTTASVRVAAVRALVRCGPEHLAEATEVLRAATTCSNPREVLARIDAATGIAALGPEHADIAAETLRDILAHAHTAADERGRAARALREVGPEHEVTAANALRAIRTAADAAVADRTLAAEWLAELGPAYIAEAAEALHAVIAAPEAGAGERHTAVTALGALGSDQAAEAIRLLREDLAADDNDAFIVAASAETLVQLAPDSLTEVLDPLRRLLSAPTSTARFRCDVARTMARLDPDRVREAATVIRAAFAAPTSRAYERSEAALRIGELGPEYIPEAASMLSGLLAAPTTGTAERYNAALNLAGLGPAFVPAAVRALRAILTAPDADDSARARAAQGMSRLGAAFVPEVVDVLGRLFSAPESSAAVRETIARALMDLAPDQAPRLAAVLRTLLAASDASAHDRIEHARILGYVEPGCSGDMVDVLRGVLNAPDTRIVDRRRAADALATRGKPTLAEGTSALRDLLTDPDANTDTRIWIAYDLSHLGREGRAAATSVFRDIFTSATAKPAERALAAQLMRYLGQGYAEEGIHMLRAILEDPESDARIRVGVAGSWSNLGPGFAEDAASILRSVIENAESDSGLRRVAAWELGWLGPDYAVEAQETLRQLLVSSHLDAKERCKAAEALLIIGNGYKGDIAEAMRGLATDPATSTFTRVAAAKTLGNLGIGYVEEGAERLRTFLASPDFTPAARGMAANELARLGQGYHAEGILALRRLLGSPEAEAEANANADSDTGTDTEADAETPAGTPAGAHDRVSIARLLFGFGPPYIPEAADAVRAVLADPASGAYVRIRAARLLGDLSPRFVDEAAGELRRLLADADLAAAPVSTRRAAAALGLLSPRFRAEAAEVLRGLPAGGIAPGYGSGAGSGSVLGTGTGDGSSRSDAESDTGAGTGGAPSTYARRAVTRILRDFGQGYAP
ncbi:caspase family protein [Embleya sp. NPDC050493]|uniref:caspase, EACC1-associated type n=1 Tax=Embleya sp. NPDC050493 TaxID=3363989 RepID=UPI0037BCC11B